MSGLARRQTDLSSNTDLNYGLQISSNDQSICPGLLIGPPHLIRHQPLNSYLFVVSHPIHLEQALTLESPVSPILCGQVRHCILLHSSNSYVTESNSLLLLSCLLPIKSRKLIPCLASSFPTINSNKKWNTTSWGTGLQSCLYPAGTGLFPLPVGLSSS